MSIISCSKAPLQCLKKNITKFNDYGIFNTKIWLFFIIKFRHTYSLKNGLKSYKNKFYHSKSILSPKITVYSVFTHIFFFFFRMAQNVSIFPPSNKCLLI